MKAMHRLRHSRQLRGDRGSVALELAAIAPAILLLIMICVQTGFYFHARQVATNAARAGAEAGRADGATPGQGAAEARKYLNSFGNSLDGGQVSTAGSTPDTVRIEVTGHVATLVPGLRFGVRQSVEAPVEKVAP